MYCDTYNIYVYHGRLSGLVGPPGLLMLYPVESQFQALNVQYCTWGGGGGQ